VGKKKKPKPDDDDAEECAEGTKETEKCPGPENTKRDVEIEKDI